MCVFLIKFAMTWCKRFPPHLNNVSTLPCEMQHSCFVGKWQYDVMSAFFKFEVFTH